jgi:hypothetical protein
MKHFYIKYLLKNWMVRASILAALFYSSWPLGYLLDPVVEKTALASELQALHRPYNWVFILSDVVTGVICLLIGFWQLQKKPKGLIRVVILCLLGFGALVAVAALTPLSCEPGTPACSASIHNYRLVAHGFASIVSVTLLFISLAAASLCLHKTKLVGKVGLIVHALIIAWIFFAVGSILEIIFHIHGNLLQHYFISICSLSIVTIVATIELYLQRYYL